jgi:hypothetical protein
MHAHLILLSLLFACDDESSKGGTSSDDGASDSAIGDTDSESPTDADGDGASAEEDCDDTDATVAPGRPETCDGRDDDCDGMIDEESTDAATWYADSDGDGHAGALVSIVACEAPDETWATVMVDCDDLNPAVHPDATEQCNSIDDDCDGLLDDADDSVDVLSQLPFYLDADNDGWGGEVHVGFACEPPPGFSDTNYDCDDANSAIHPETWWYNDADSDSFGDASVALQSCLPPADSFVFNSTDCDDTNNAVHPGAVEVCNGGTDDNCDTLADDDDSSVDASTLTDWYADADGDGFGDADISTAACLSPPSFVSDSTDCNDRDLATNPAATEICADGIDNNCNGGSDSCGLPDGATVASADTPLTGLSTGDNFGFALAVGDFDGDGTGDILVGDPSDDAAGTSAGALYFFPGPVTATSATPIAFGTAAGDQTGYSIASAGDVDGDSVLDSLWGSPGASYTTSSGTVSLCFGDPSNGNTALFYSNSIQAIGSGIAGIDDINGDGLDDIAIGGPGADTVAANGGVIYLFTTMPTPGSTTLLTQADAIWYGTGTNASLGYLKTIQSGDLNGDGALDLAVGEYNSVGGDGRVGIVYDIGNYTGTYYDTDADVLIAASSSNAALGARVTAHPDLTGDGLDDLVLVEFSYNSYRGRVWLVSGSTSAYLSGSSVSSLSTWSVTGVSSSDYAGRGLSIGDWNTDGFFDLQVSASGYDAYQPSGGGIFVYEGPLSSGTYTIPSADVTLKPNASGQSLGSYGVSAGEVTGDGADDLLFESPIGVGTVYLFEGGGL